MAEILKRLVLAGVLASLAIGSARASLLVQTDAGLVQGDGADGVTAFKGIPYAAPPVGPLRWKAPQPAARWSGVRQVTEFGAPC